MDISNRTRSLGMTMIWVLALCGLASALMLYAAGAAPVGGVFVTDDITINGPIDVVPGVLYTYTISYSDVQTTTEAIRYVKPASNTMPYQDPDNEWVKVVSISPTLPISTVGNYDPLYVWSYAKLQNTDTITLVVEYTACGKFSHVAEIFDTYDWGGPNPSPNTKFTLSVTSNCKAYLPETFQGYLTATSTPSPTPTPFPPLASTWQAVGPKTLNAAAVEWTGAGQLHVGDSTATSLTGGAYRGDIDYCNGAENVVLGRLLNDTQVLDVSFGSDGNGVLGTFDGRTAFYSATDRTWRMTNTAISPVVYSVLYVSSSRAYAGGENGLYQSDDGGSTWRLVGGPKRIDALKLTTDGNVLWLGTLGAGIWNHPINTSNFNPVNTGLQNNSLLVRDIDIHEASGTVYISTQDGVFRLINVTWEKLGLAEKILLTIEIENSNIYVGGRETGVLRASVDSPNQWIPIIGDIPSSGGDLIRDIDYVSDLCRGQGGLIAGTNRGVWFYPLPK